jgi:glycine/sarcosine N-methyltransferase
MKKDVYQDFAKRYDWMKTEDPVRKEFFRNLFAKNNVSRVLDCACGTGHDLIIFHFFGCEAQGADLSEAMLTQARKNLTEANLEIHLLKADYRYLDQHFTTRFDAVTCLSNAINEPLQDDETLRALQSMRAVLRDGGLLILDQGQTDATMKNPPKFVPVVNDRDRSRLFVITYSEDQMHVQVFDFIHTEQERDFRYNAFHIRIRLKDDWERILKQAGFTCIEYFGDWSATPYDKEQSKRLIIVAHK